MFQLGSGLRSGGCGACLCGTLDTAGAFAAGAFAAGAFAAGAFAAGAFAGAFAAGAGGAFGAGDLSDPRDAKDATLRGEPSVAPVLMAAVLMARRSGSEHTRARAARARGTARASLRAHLRRVSM